MTFDGQIEASQSIAAERIRSALENDAFRSVELHDRRHDWLEHEVVIVYTEEADRQLSMLADLLTYRRP